MKEGVSPNVEAIDRAPKTIRPILTRLAEIEIEGRSFEDVVKEIDEATAEIETKEGRKLVEMSDALAKWLDSNKDLMNGELGLMVANLNYKILLSFYTLKLARLEESESGWDPWGE